MIKTTSAMLIAAGALSSTPAAHATFEYRFNVINIRCDDPSLFCFADSWKDVLNAVSVNLTGTPASINTESERYGVPGGETNVYSSHNFLAANFDRIGAVADPWKQACTTPSRCIVRGEFDLSSNSYLIGSLIASSLHVDLNMKSGPDTIWRGYVIADGGHSMPGYYPVFSGMWLLVPEPSPIVLIGAGLAALIWVRRRKDTRKQL